MIPSLVLIDTSVWIYALGKQHISAIKDRVDELMAEDRVSVCPIVYLELLAGTKTTAEFNRLKEYLDDLRDLTIGDQEWMHAAQLAYDLRRHGNTIPNSDIIIAATAIRSDAIVLHADSHFDVIAETTELKVESLVSLVRNRDHKGT